MPRLVFLALCVILGSTIVAPGLAAIDACVESCPDDDCPPDCSSCKCCPHVTRSLTVARAAGARPPAPSRHPIVWTIAHDPSAPEPQDIFHVPKAAPTRPNTLS